MEMVVWVVVLVREGGYKWVIYLHCIPQAKE